MKKTGCFFLVICASFFSVAQDISGQWSGLLKTQGVELRLVFNVNKTGDSYTATLDSPDQNAHGIPVSSILCQNDSVKIEAKSIYAKYEGKYQIEDSITGIFYQMGVSIPLNLKKGKVPEKIVMRPQEPMKPYLYYTEEVKFLNKTDGNTLAGTLTLPSKEGVYPVVVMITGSGPQNRDEELLGHKPFLIIADFLTRNGIGVLRYDDRGTAHSTGNFKQATTYDFSKDVEAAINYLLTRKDINKKKIGLIGHSEGGIIAPMVAARNKNVAFIVMLAGTGVRGDKLLLMQSQAVGKASGISDKELTSAYKINREVYDLVLKSTDVEQLRLNLNEYLRKTMKNDTTKSVNLSKEQSESQIKMLTEQMTSPWMQYLLKYDPIPALEKIKIPVLALNGSKDLQVPADENLPPIQQALQKGGNKKNSIVKIEGLNHLFQECENGTPNEYGKIEQTFSPEALNVMLNWINMQIK
ncbi:MAG: alpha/beta hydrolase [Paludibacteraceae bacterium]